MYGRIGELLLYKHNNPRRDSFPSSSTDRMWLASLDATA